ncbi:MAG: MotA/TolQ/ExbB proton channel family protein [Succinivibrio sp.]
MSLISFYEYAGPLGAIILFLALLSLFLCIRAYIYTSLAWSEFKRDYVKKEDGLVCLKEYTGHNPFLNIIRSMVSTHQNHTDDLRAEVMYLFGRNFKTIMNSLTVLKMISVISPLLGLLGTVLGMLTIFDEISHLAAQDPKILASGIYQALITTVMGLSVAIPVLVVFYLLSLRMKIFLSESIEYTYQAVSMFNKIAEHHHETSV